MQEAGRNLESLVSLLLRRIIRGNKRAEAKCFFFGSFKSEWVIRDVFWVKGVNVNPRGSTGKDF